MKMSIYSAPVVLVTAKAVNIFWVVNDFLNGCTKNDPTVASALVLLKRASNADLHLCSSSRVVLCSRRVENSAERS